MKKFTTLLVFALALFATNNIYAKVWRVNNNPGVAADFTDAQTAHNAASAGDTIHFEPSASTYGGLNVTKKIHIVGNGFYLVTDTGLQANTTATVLSSVDFQVGSANSSIQGMNSSYIYVEDQNILVQRNNVSYIYLYAGCTNSIIRENWAYYIGQQTGPITGIYIGNNIFAGGASVNMGTTSTGTFENNNSYTGNITLYNFQVDNNISWSTSYTIANNVFFNNIGDGVEFPAGNSNQQNVNMNNVFTNTGTGDIAWKLKAGSPALGTGYNGVDCGAYGGPNPYKLGGIPNVPAIYSLTVPSVGTSTLNVTISTRSNN